MKCSFVVSAFNRPQHLACLLRSLQIQSEPDFEVLVMDNATHGEGNMAAVEQLEDSRFTHYACRLADCYVSANHGAEKALGEYLCFPSDDGYYVPRFLQTMLAKPADLMYCDCIYDGHGIHYAPMDGAPVAGRIDKGGFLLRREKFTGFAGPPKVDRAADAWLIEALIRTGVTHTKAPGHLWVHN